MEITGSIFHNHSHRTHILLTHTCTYTHVLTHQPIQSLAGPYSLYAAWILNYFFVVLSQAFAQTVRFPTVSAFGFSYHHRKHCSNQEAYTEVINPEDFASGSLLLCALITLGAILPENKGLTSPHLCVLIALHPHKSNLHEVHGRTFLTRQVVTPSSRLSRCCSMPSSRSWGRGSSMMRTVLPVDTHTHTHTHTHTLSTHGG